MEPTARCTVNRIRFGIIGLGLLAALLGLPGPVTATSHWRVPVLLYHIITPAVPAGADGSLYVRASEFEAQMRAAAARGIRAITARDMAASIRAGVPIPARTMVLTFDDGREEIFRYARPIMARYGSSLEFRNGRWTPLDANGDGVPDQGYIGTLFVIDGRQIGGFLSFDQMAVLARAGYEIANHTRGHVPVSDYHGTALFDRIVVAGTDLSAAMAERGAGSGPTATFAYPFGAVSAEAEAVLRAAGYRAAFTTDSAVAHTGQNLLLLPRVRVRLGESAADFLRSMGYSGATARQFAPDPFGRARLANGIRPLFL